MKPTPIRWVQITTVWQVRESGLVGSSLHKGQGERGGVSKLAGALKRANRKGVQLCMVVAARARLET